LSAEKKLIAGLREVIEAYPLTVQAVAAILELRRRLATYEFESGTAASDTAEESTPTVRVRVAAAVNANGEWHACGADGNSDEESATSAKDMLDGYPLMNVSFIEARVPLPVPRAVTVQGEVKPKDGSDGEKSQT
jgi:hypothetical protein